jgi:NADPH2:quinone reductase
MHAWLCETPTGVDALNWKELPTPQPKAGEVLIEIKAASLNFPDLLIVQNKYQMKPALPFVPGSEYAGVVQAVGEGVTHLTVGQAVACLSGTGGFGTHTLAPAALCMPLPPGFPMVDAAAFIMIYATSHHALVDRAQLKAGETVLVLGAAGGVGTSAIQIAKAMGDCGRFHAGKVRSVQINRRRCHHQLHHRKSPRGGQGAHRWQRPGRHL